MTESKFKTMRHIETVRNYINAVIVDLLGRAESHDQSKLTPAEVDVFDKFTPLLRTCTYGSDEYKSFLEQMEPALKNHYTNNRHHPEHFENGIQDMNLVDIIEMLIDWKCSGLRHNDGCIFKSIEINQKRFGYSDEMKAIFINTANWLNSTTVYHRADES